MTKGQPLDFQSLKKAVVFTLKLQLHCVVLNMVYRHISGRIWAFLFHKTTTK